MRSVGQNYMSSILVRNIFYMSSDILGLIFASFFNRDLSRNKFEKLGALMFTNLTKLEFLKLKRNQITEPSVGAFYGLESINTL